MKFIKTLFVCLLVIGGIAYVKYRTISKAIAEHANFMPPPDAVSTLTAKEEVWQQSIAAIASVASSQGTMLSAEEPGKIIKINFTSGAAVKAGDVLVQLDTATEEAQLKSAEAKTELARTNLTRAKNLRPTNAVSQSDYDTYVSQVKQYEADANAIRALIAKKTIVAPFSGRAGIRVVNEGQFVRQGDPIVPLHALDPVYVNFSVPQQQIGQVKLGATVDVSVDAFPADRFVAKVTAINPQVNESTRNADIQATLPNPEEKVRPGMYATVAITLDASQTVIPVPASAISYAPYGNAVYVIEPGKMPDGKEGLTIRQQFVTLGEKRGDQVAILSGLKPGERIATSGLFKLRPGGFVQINDSIKPGNNPNPSPADT